MNGTQEVILGGSLLIALPIALLAGILSFFTPCSLPLVPGYLSYVAGMAGTPGPERVGAERVGAERVGAGRLQGTQVIVPSSRGRAASRQARARTLGGAALFVLGFAAVFTVYGALFGAAGSVLTAHQDLLVRVSGGVTIVLGLLFAGAAGRLPGLNRTIRLRWSPRAGLLGAPALGAVFGIGWTPCVGPALAAVLTLATTSATAERGALLTLTYAIGLGLPFLLAAWWLTGALRLFAWVRSRSHLVSLVGGVVLVGVGLLQVTGVWAGLVAHLQVLIAGWQAPL